MQRILEDRTATIGPQSKAPARAPARRAVAPRPRDPEPALTVQILIRPGEHETLVVRRGEAVEHAVASFCELHGLRGPLEAKIVRLISEKLGPLGV